MYPSPITKVSLTPSAWIVAALIALFIAISLGCALAQPFAPNANAASTATNAATASPSVTVTAPTVSVPSTQPANP